MVTLIGQIFFFRDQMRSADDTACSKRAMFSSERFSCSGLMKDGVTLDRSPVHPRAKDPSHAVHKLLLWLFISPMHSGSQRCNDCRLMLHKKGVTLFCVLSVQEHSIINNTIDVFCPNRWNRDEAQDLVCVCVISTWLKGNRFQLDEHYEWIELRYIQNKDILE